ncbi:hypothetical protein Tsubulata_016608 [Turnera subulata]|uniref:Uncharacterized protein n=1 Tax=Turnera subulata TaxID=218843 RepID=A0A9Q0JC04_9ROSI|nr:hypothetical protein Tsubulata_016608 [Turnera subulata]
MRASFPLINRLRILDQKLQTLVYHAQPGNGLCKFCELNGTGTGELIDEEGEWGYNRRCLPHVVVFSSVHKKLPVTMAQLEAIYHELQSLILVPQQGDIVPEKVNSDDVPESTASTVSVGQAAYASFPSAKLAQDSGP